MTDTNVTNFAAAREAKAGPATTRELAALNSNPTVAIAEVVIASLNGNPRIAPAYPAGKDVRDAPVPETRKVAPREFSEADIVSKAKALDLWVKNTGTGRFNVYQGKYTRGGFDTRGGAEALMRRYALSALQAGA